MRREGIVLFSCRLFMASPVYRKVRNFMTPRSTLLLNSTWVNCGLSPLAEDFLVSLPPFLQIFFWP